MFDMTNIRLYLINKLLTVPIILIALTVHEISHGYAAYKLGDPTAKTMGRLSLNPLKHIDPIGALCMLLFGFGWARPVPIDTRYFKKPKRDMALTALAGPLSNLILGFIGVIVYRIGAGLIIAHPAEGFWLTTQIMALTFMQYFVQLNVGLSVFNFIPIPPLDGSRVLYVFLPPKYYFGIMKYERYIMIAMLALLWLGVLDPIISTAVKAVITGMEWVVSLIPFI